MESIEFVNNYEKYLQEIQSVAKPVFQPIIDELLKIDPHDLVTPDSWFQNKTTARGLVWCMFVKRAGSVPLNP